MDNEEILRQQAINLSLQGQSVKSISKELGRTRQWVYKWLHEYNQSSNTTWSKSKSHVPKNIKRKTSNEIEKIVIEIRKRLSKNPYAQKGSISILYEFERLGIKPPSTATINRILKRNNFIEKNTVKHLKRNEYPTYFFNVQEMDLIGPNYLKGGFKFYFYCIIDTQTHYAGVYPISTKSAMDIVPCLIDFWRSYGMPDYLQMDNELSFKGSNRYPRGLGTLLRLAISNQVIPIFTPPAEPWRNGIIEKFNDNQTSLKITN
jgi:transposase